MTKTLEEMELLIIDIRADIAQVYEDKSERKEIQEIDKKILNALLDKFESAVIIRNLMQNPCL